MTKRFESKPFYYRLKGDYALFTDPVTKGGGEKFSYQVPTYQALKGITEGIYWKPTLIYVIDEVRVINQIQSETMGVRPIITLGKNGGNDLSYYTYLRDVEYHVKFHFEWNLNRNNLAHDRQEIKHQQILLRAMEKGGRRDIFLGTRECVGHIDRLSEDDYEAGTSYYDNDQLNFGIMFHSFTYSSESEFDKEKSDKLISNFAPIQLQNGTVKFIRPEDCLIRQELGNYYIKNFNKQNVRNVEDEILQLVSEGEVFE